jgi:hypothetical protein
MYAYERDFDHRAIFLENPASGMLALNVRKGVISGQISIFRTPRYAPVKQLLRNNDDYSGAPSREGVDMGAFLRSGVWAAHIRTGNAAK